MSPDLIDRLPCPACPAATPIAGPPDRGPGVLCGVWFREEREGQIEEAEQGVLVTLYNDPTTLHVYCCGEGVPGARNSYTSCPVYERERERRDDREKTLALNDPDEDVYDPHADAADYAGGDWDMGDTGYFC